MSRTQNDDSSDVASPEVQKPSGTLTADTSSPLETSVAWHVSALVFASALPTLATLLYFILLSGSPWMKGVYFFSKLLQFSFPLLWVVLIQKRRIQLARPSKASLIAGFLVGIAIVGIGLLAYHGFLKGSVYLQNAPALISEKTNDMGLTTPTIYLLFALFLSVPHSFMEEYYWRWFVFGQTRRISGIQIAIIFSSIGFMAHHVIVIHQFLQNGWAVTIFFSLCVALGGAIWAWLYDRYQSLYGPWISHLMVDLGIMYIGYDLLNFGN